MGGKWEFPGGKVEPGETDAQAVQREYLEEFGIVVAAGATLGESSFVNGGKHYELAAVLVYFDGEPVSLYEHDEYRWVDETELGNLDLAASDSSLVPFVVPLLVVS